jgi:hypothetical protein
MCAEVQSGELIANTSAQECLIIGSGPNCECVFGNAVPPWDTSKPQLWSLAEMIVWASTNFVGMYGNLYKFIGVLDSAIQSEPSRRGGVLSPAMRERLALNVAGFAVQECKHLNLENLEISTQNAQSMKQRLEREHPYTASEMLAELTLLMQTIIQELSKRKLAYIAPPYDVYFEQEKLFGDSVFDIFPEARQDVKDAGNCLAASLPTACVFHLMRVSEHGLRKLATKLKVKLTHSGKPCPLEFGDWDKVITAIRNKILEARKLPAGPKRQAKFEAYSNAADHCEYMKDIWRNNTAHARRPYSHNEALGAMNRVRDFMELLARGL